MMFDKKTIRSKIEVLLPQFRASADVADVTNSSVFM